MRNWWFIAVCVGVVALIVFAFMEGEVRFWGVWGAGAFTFMALAMLLRAVILPQLTVARGIDLIRAQDFNNRLTKVGQRDADKTVALFNTMIDRLREERLRNLERESFMRLLTDASPMGVAILDFDGKISMVNPAFLKITGLGDPDSVPDNSESVPGNSDRTPDNSDRTPGNSDRTPGNSDRTPDNSDRTPDNSNSILGKRLTDIHSDLVSQMPDIPEGERRVIRRGDVRRYRCYHLSFMQSGFARPFYLLETLTEEMMRAEREAYEKVIRIISHEVNNTMGGVRSVLDTIAMSLPDPDLAEVIESCDNTDVAEVIQSCDNTDLAEVIESSDDTDLADVIQSCDDRCARLSAFINAYADVVRVPAPVKRPEPIDQRLREMLPFLRQFGREGVEITLDTGCPGRTVDIDLPLLQQALLNIVKNAVESIPIPDPATPTPIPDQLTPTPNQDLTSSEILPEAPETFSLGFRDLSPDQDTLSKGSGTESMGSDTKCMGPDTKSMGSDTKCMGPDTKCMGPDTKSVGPEINSVETNFHSINGKVYIRTMEERGKVVLEVVDNGLPITPEVANRLFNPFFTTKPEGCGIGLTLTAEILNRHGITYSLRTDPDRLTRFRLLFP